MERIDSLWDAWEDCLCKEELRAEFDRLKSENEKLEKSRQAFIKILDETMLENEKLSEETEKLKNTPVAKLYLEAVADRVELSTKLHQAQSHLDTICEPIRTEGDIGYIKRTVIPLLYELGKTISAQTLERVLAYLDSQKPSEKPSTERHGGWISVGSELPSGKWGKSYPWLSEEVLIVNSCSIEIGYYNRQDGAWYVGEPAKEEWIDKITHWMPLPVNPHVCSPKCEHKNGGISYYSEGVLRQWCDDCKKWFFPKPLTQCPECIWGQKKVQYERKCLDYPYTQFYFVYERCPRCKGEGRIPC